jgi:hypothetical protein
VIARNRTPDGNRLLVSTNSLGTWSPNPTRQAARRKPARAPSQLPQHVRQPAYVFEWVQGAVGVAQFTRQWQLGERSPDWTLSTGMLGSTVSADDETAVRSEAVVGPVRVSLRGTPVSDELTMTVSRQQPQDTARLVVRLYRGAAVEEVVPQLSEEFVLEPERTDREWRLRKVDFERGRVEVEAPAQNQ